MGSRSGGQAQVHSITAAPRSHSEDIDRRIRRYIVSMSIRTLCLLLVVLIHHPVRWLFAAGAVFLPYVAVVMANAGRRRSAAVLTPVDRLSLTADSVPAQRPSEDT
jgi:hypothetical protein